MSGSRPAEGGRGTRQEQKERTRRALLAAALRRLEEQSLSSLSVREVTRAVGIAPAAFYRHFRDMSDLGVALVEEALGGLHTVVRRILTELDDSTARIDRAVELIAGHVRAHPAHIRFLARERHGGVRAVRQAIAAELDRFADEVAGALGGDAARAQWSPEELRMLAELYVDHMVMTASALLVAAEGEGRDEAGTARAARRQLRLISLGSEHYRPEGGASGGA
ncbi:TetR family transcriptional regulator [Streptomyces sp. JJ36]|nr:TetR family transcriptional regulator [Streptomyces sp. JJ36]